MLGTHRRIARAIWTPNLIGGNLHLDKCITHSDTEWDTKTGCLLFLVWEAGSDCLIFSI